MLHIPMNKENIIKFLKYLLVAICSAIVSYFSSSCAGGIVIGTTNKQYQEVSTSTDSTALTPTISINR